MSEARLASLYLTLREQEEINRSGLLVLRADNLDDRVSKLLHTHIDGTDAAMSRVIREHEADLSS